jgi:zinc transport system substrate-binding protein
MRRLIVKYFGQKFSHLIINSWMKQLGIVPVVGVACLLFIFMPPGEGISKSPVKTFVSILPQAYFVERIGGQHVTVHVLVGPGQSPATYEPTPQQMAALAESQVYFRIGTPFEEAFIGKIAGAFKSLEIIDTRQGVPLRYFQGTGDKQIPDPHIWLDPKRVKIQAQTISKALRRLASTYAEDFENNLRTFQRDLDIADAKIAEALAPVKGERFYVFHPAFGYFAESYGLQQMAIEIEGKEPSAKQLADLMDRAKKDHVRVIFVQPQYAKKDAEAVAKAIGGAVVPMNPLPRDYLTSLQEIATILRDGLLRR